MAIYLTVSFSRDLTLFYLYLQLLPYHRPNIYLLPRHMDSLHQTLAVMSATTVLSEYQPQCNRVTCQADLSLKASSVSGKKNATSPLEEWISEVHVISPTSEPLIHPVTQEKLVPFHVLRADYLSPDMILPIGHLTLPIIKEMIAFDKNRYTPIFDFYPRPSKEEVILNAIERCFVVRSNCESGERSYVIRYGSFNLVHEGKGNNEEENL